MIVIAHRGASGERPEHTRSAYQLAIAEGCDFIEPDLVVSRDGVLIVRHENEISGTTDVADHPEFAARRTCKVIDGQTLDGWFTEDFDLAELKTLRCRERLPDLRPANTAWDGADPILSFEELIVIARDGGVGVYAELKHPAWFRGIGLDLESRTAADLASAGWTTCDAPVILESFEPTSVQRLRTLTGCRTGQLIAADGAPADGFAMSFAEMVEPAGLARVAAWADAIGPDKVWLERRPGLVADAHAAGLRVHPWTYRAEDQFLPQALRGLGGEGLRREIAGAIECGVDGLFCDFPATAVEVRDAFRPGAAPGPLSLGDPPL